MKKEDIRQLNNILNDLFNYRGALDFYTNKAKRADLPFGRLSMALQSIGDTLYHLNEAVHNIEREMEDERLHLKNLEEEEEIRKTLEDE